MKNSVVAPLVVVGCLLLAPAIQVRSDSASVLTPTIGLSPQSQQVVRGLQQDLLIQAFVEHGVNPTLQALLEDYRRASGKVHFEMIDPDRRVDLARRYGVTAYNIVRLQYGNKTTTIVNPNEEALRVAIWRVTNVLQQTLCFVEGHGEPRIDATQDAHGLSAAKESLANDTYQVTKVLLPRLEKVPGHCSLLVVADPERPYLAEELTALDRYLQGSGRVLLLLPPQHGDEFAPMLEKWGVKLGNDVVVDQVLRLFQKPAQGIAPIVNTYDGAHEITRDFHQFTIFPKTRSVSANSTGRSGLQVTELAKTRPSSWAETDLDGVFKRSQATLDSADRKGPISIAVAVQANLIAMGFDKDGEARLAVFGSAEFAGNREWEGTYYKRDLFLNTVAWLLPRSD